MRTLYSIDLPLTTPTYDGIADAIVHVPVQSEPNFMLFGFTLGIGLKRIICTVQEDMLATDMYDNLANVQRAVAQAVEAAFEKAGVLK